MTSQEVARFKTISAKEFAYWGMKDFVYIRCLVVEGQRSFAIHAANGTPVAVMETLVAAQAAVLQNDLEP
ncbi:MAG TPA: DUF1150 family protein, partial [Stellaceae bacterium]|nr:DUF1150 family protein [Stellaceae bacterium]